jgi:GNAT superfamily N-acetyltransferase
MTQMAPPTRTIPIRGYRPSDHSACRRLWAELTAEHRARYPGTQFGPTGEAVDVDPADPGAGFEEYLTRLDLSGMWVAHHSEDGVVGFVGLILRGRAGAVEPVIVTEHRRGRGIGRALLEHVADQARRRGLRELSISPALRNAEAIHCLHRSGYDTAATVTLTLDLTGRTGPAGEEIELHGVHFAY